jgi:hypothetical protein
MEYELYQFLNYLGAGIVFLIIAYHFLELEEAKKQVRAA